MHTMPVLNYPPRHPWSLTLRILSGFENASAEDNL